MSKINQKERDRKYNNWARRNPAIISIVFPLLVSVYFFQNYTSELSNTRYIVGVILSFSSIIPALLFFYQTVIRDLAIFIVEKLIFRVFGKPAVNLLKKKNSELSQKRRERLLKKAQAIEIIVSSAPDKEKEYEEILCDFFEQIREKVRDNSIVFEFNCFYGFYRNLSAGLIVDLLMCLGLFFLNFKKKIGPFLGISSIVIFLLLVFCLICTYASAKRYAKRVYVLYDDRENNKDK